MDYRNLVTSYRQYCNGRHILLHQTSRNRQACAVNQTMTITVNPLITPTFTQVDPICNGDVLADYPLHRITDYRNLVTSNRQYCNDDIYFYTRYHTTSQACAVNQTMTITVNPLITPTFTQVDPICNGDVLAHYPLHRITDYRNLVTSYRQSLQPRHILLHQTPRNSQACAVNQTMEITVNPLITPTFTQVDPICNGDVLAITHYIE